jgi:alpha-tubulin suppressor-like RCC1 family protein
VSAGLSHTCGVTTLGTALCWGSNEFGELGNGGYVPSGLPGATAPDPTFLGFTYLSTSVGDRFSCGLQSSTDAYCWGRGLEGQLGNAHSFILSVPSRIYDGLAVTAIAAGYDHACALDPLGRVFCWGESSRGQTGTPRRSATTLPAQVHIP